MGYIWTILGANIMQLSLRSINLELLCNTFLIQERLLVALYIVQYPHDELTKVVHHFPTLHQGHHLQHEAKNKLKIRVYRYAR